MKKPKLIVFDMDGVLIDVSRSYRETVRKAARLFLSGAEDFGGLPDPLFPLADLAELKQTGGLNNDWDLTARVLHLLFSMVKKSGDASSWGGSPAPTIHACTVSELATFLHASPHPLMELHRRCGLRNDPFVADCFQGDVETGNIIKRIFQEIYLGPSLFGRLYGRAPHFYKGKGLIHEESLLIDPALLADLSRDHILAIATGRPQAEADFPLDRFDLRKYFQLMLTLDDCTREEERILAERGEGTSLKKPAPYMLDRIPQLIERGFGECYYLGDMPDDMLAARSSRTGYHGVGVILSSPEPEGLRRELLRSGADHIMEKYSDLPGIIAR